MSKKYLICSLAVLSFLAMNVDAKGYQREGCGGGGCNSGCRAPTDSYQGYRDADGPYYDHRGPDVAPLHRDGPPPVSPGARIPDNRRPTRFQGELPQAPTTGNGHHYFNPATVSMFKGDVVSVTRIEGPNGGQIVRVVFHTNQGDDVELRTGPSSFLEEKKFSLREGDKIDVKGSKVNWNGRTIIIAQEIKRDGETLVLRDKDGKPSWKESDSELRDREEGQKATTRSYESRERRDVRVETRDDDNRDLRGSREDRYNDNRSSLFNNRDNDNADRRDSRLDTRGYNNQARSSLFNSRYSDDDNDNRRDSRLDTRGYNSQARSSLFNSRYNDDDNDNRDRNSLLNRDSDNRRDSRLDNRDRRDVRVDTRERRDVRVERNVQGYNTNRYNTQGYTQGYNAPSSNSGCSAQGYNARGYNNPGYNQSYNTQSYTNPGYNQSLNTQSYVAPSYNQSYNYPSYNAQGYNTQSYNYPYNTQSYSHQSYTYPYGSQGYSSSTSTYPYSSRSYDSQTYNTLDYNFDRTDNSVW